MENLDSFLASSEIVFPGSKMVLHPNLNVPSVIPLSMYASVVSILVVYQALK